MKLIRTQDAVGQVLCHDITQIIPGITKDAVFRKGHIIREEDIPILLSVGKEHIYIWENNETMLHENDAADILRAICQNAHMRATPPKDGKIELIDVYKRQACDIIYICSPNNPTGAAYDRAGLQAWVEYANAQHAVILYDAAYECFIEDVGLPRSIYEIEGAKTCAVEFCSFSKMAGFTGTRCGWTIVPKALADGKLNKMWLRRQTTKFNGVPYIVQKGAAACFTEAGMQQIRETLGYYKQNAKVLSETLDSLGIWYTGGKNSPYLWLKCPNSMDSWTFFDYLLEHAHVVGTPGAGFGKNGDGFFRLTAFGDQQRTVEAAERLKKLLG